MRCAFIWLLVSLALRLLINERWIFSKIVKISDFWILSGWIEKNKSTLSKLDFSWDNSYCVRLVIVSLAANINNQQALVSEDIFFCWVYNDFCIEFLLCDVLGFSRIQNSIVKKCLDKKILDRPSSFEIYWIFYHVCWWRFQGVFYELMKYLY